MEPQELEKNQVNTTNIKNLKIKLKKWWLIPITIVLVFTPLTLVLTLPKKQLKPNNPISIIDNIFNYQSMNFNDFKVTVDRYSQIKQEYIATVTKTADIYLTKKEWQELEFSQNLIIPKTVKAKIINNLSNNLRLIGLIESKKILNVDDYEFSDLILERLKTNELIDFKSNLKHKTNNQLSLPIGGHLNQSKEIISPLKTIDNETMPRLLNELKTNSVLRNSVNWNYYGFWYGMETIGAKAPKTGEWLEQQKIDLNNFNQIALSWFLDTLKKTNLIDYNVDFKKNDLHFFVNGWNKDKLYLNDKNGIEITKDYVILSPENWPWNPETKKVASIVSTIEFGWQNPFDNEIIKIDITGSYILTPVWKAYDQK